MHPAPIMCFALLQITLHCWSQPDLWPCFVSNWKMLTECSRLAALRTEWGGQLQDANAPISHNMCGVLRAHDCDVNHRYIRCRCVIPCIIMHARVNDTAVSRCDGNRLKTNMVQMNEAKIKGRQRTAYHEILDTSLKIGTIHSAAICAPNCARISMVCLRVYNINKLEAHRCTAIYQQERARTRAQAKQCVTWVKYQFCSLLGS